jgi:hypothetical protein
MWQVSEHTQKILLLVLYAFLAAYWIYSYIYALKELEEMQVSKNGHTKATITKLETPIEKSEEVKEHENR